MSQNINTWIIVSMSTEYFYSLLNQGPESKERREVLEFWRFGDELKNNASNIYFIHRFHGAETGGGPEEPSLLLTITALAPVAISIIQAVTKYLTRNDNRELTIETGKDKITLKGRSLPEEKELLEWLFPNLIEK